MRFQSQSILVDTSRADRADEALVQAILDSAGDPETLVKAVAGRTQKDVRDACERLFFDDRRSAALIVSVGVAARSSSIVGYALRLMEDHCYYDNAQRSEARSARESLERQREADRAQRTLKKKPR